MKRIFINIILLGLVAFLQIACEKDETLTVAKSDAEPAKLSATKTTLTLDEADADQDAVTFSWTAADFGFSAAVNYSLEFGKKDSNFVNAKTIDLGNSKERTMTVGALNAIANGIRLKGFVANEMEVRIRADIGGTVKPVYSSVVLLNITPYLDKPPYQTLYMVGDATVGGWDNKAATPMFRATDNVFLFTYTGKFKKGYFKFLGTLGKWAPMWGRSSSGGVFFRATEADPDPDAFEVQTEGYYTVTLNLRNTSFSMTPFDASSAKVYNSIGIIGPFTGWSAIAPMTASDIDPHIWTINYTFAEDTEMKFRIAEGWSENWGAESNATESNPYGLGVSNGPNMKVKKGNYLIRFNDITKNYILIAQ